MPIVQAPVFDEDAGMLLVDDTDLYAPKLATDVVVHGAVCAPEPVTRLEFGVAVGKHTRTLMAIGQRHARVSSDGMVRFSEPEPFERIELSYQHAYGGYDQRAHDLLSPPDEETAARMRALEEGRIADDGDFPVRAKSLFAYPRNPAGVGYHIDVERTRADGARLPQFEDPEDGLTPGRFFVPEPPAWMAAPVAAGLGWVQHAWYPRLVRFAGPVLEHDGRAAPREGLLPDGDDLVDMGPRPPERIFPRALQGAAPGLAAARLRGDERIELTHLHPDHPKLKIQLPGTRPRLRITPPGLEAMRAEAVLQTVRIDTHTLQLSLTWCGAIPLAAQVDDTFLERTTFDWSE